MYKIMSVCLRLQVEILVGKDKGKIGAVNSIIKERNWVFVEGLNCVSIHTELRGSYFIKVSVPGVHDAAAESGCSSSVPEE
jgi:ribosomal protein L24